MFGLLNRLIHLVDQIANILFDLKRFLLEPTNGLRIEIVLEIKHVNFHLNNHGFNGIASK